MDNKKVIAGKAKGLNEMGVIALCAAVFGEPVSDDEEAQFISSYTKDMTKTEKETFFQEYLNGECVVRNCARNAEDAYTALDRGEIGSRGSLTLLCMEVASKVITMQTPVSQRIASMI